VQRRVSFSSLLWRGAFAADEHDESVDMTAGRGSLKQEFCSEVVQKSEEENDKMGSGGFCGSRSVWSIQDPFAAPSLRRTL
jgi:hypothetical protein